LLFCATCHFVVLLLGHQLHFIALHEQWHVEVQASPLDWNVQGFSS
jgi:hypothetical protein